MVLDRDDGFGAVAQALAGAVVQVDLGDFDVGGQTVGVDGGRLDLTVQCVVDNRVVYVAFELRSLLVVRDLLG